MSDQQFLDDLARNPELELSKYLNTKLSEKYDREDHELTLSKNTLNFNLSMENIKARDLIAVIFYVITALCFIAVAVKGVSI